MIHGCRNACNERGHAATSSPRQAFFLTDLRHASCMASFRVQVSPTLPLDCILSERNSHEYLLLTMVKKKNPKMETRIAPRLGRFQVRKRFFSHCGVSAVVPKNSAIRSWTERPVQTSILSFPPQPAMRSRCPRLASTAP